MKTSMKLRIVTGITSPFGSRCHCEALRSNPVQCHEIASSKTPRNDTFGKVIPVTILIIMVASVAYCAEPADSDSHRADTLWNQAGTLRQQGRYAEAADLYEKSAAAELASPSPRQKNLANEWLMAGYCYHQIQHYAKAIDVYEKALNIYQALGMEAEMSMLLNGIGELYRMQGQYDNALERYEHALSIDRKLGQEMNTAIRFNNIGVVYCAWGQYDTALDFYQQALEIAHQHNKEAAVAMFLMNIGRVYEEWGKYGDALPYFEHAMEIFHRENDDASIALAFASIGLVYSAWDDSDNALHYYKLALAIDQKLNRNAEVAAHLNNIGSIYMVQGEYDAALDSFKQALALVQTLDRAPEIATTLNNIGNVHEALEEYNNALEYFERALDIDRRLGREAEMAIRYNNIGAVFYVQEQYTEAIPYFVDAVALLETIRKTAPGDVRRDYFASQIHTYRFLISCYIRLGDFENAFKIIELSRAKRLEEQLAGVTTEFPIPSLTSFQHTLSDDAAVLIYANTIEHHVVQMLITHTTCSASERSYNELTRQNTSPEPANALIEQYLTQLFDPSFKSPSPEQRHNIRGDGDVQAIEVSTLSKRLYAFLIGKHRERLRGKPRLLILPDGELNILPFEMLIDPSGQYLVETHHITYAQSLGVLSVIGQRNYAPDRKPLLAFGGAVYEEETYQEELAEYDAQVSYVQKCVDFALRRGQPLGTIYAALRRKGWENLPGTLTEVNAIREAVKGAEVVTGTDVNEASIKALSDRGELAQYTLLHFATHGLINPEIPELSALVLSQISGTEDGYLRAEEIANLHLQADFVTLSACETGLGKLYSGEGMVGLPQAFLLAGANGVSVSLWSVADESTAQFMTALYTLLHKKNLSYADAMTEVKRRFINGDFGEAWKTPYFWAPFVYYGL